MAVENDTGEVRTFVIPVTWQEQGQFVVRARTLAEAIEAVENDDARFSTGSANGEYVDGSFEIVKDCITESEEVDPDDSFVDLTVPDEEIVGIGGYPDGFGDEDE